MTENGTVTITTMISRDEFLAAAAKIAEIDATLGEVRDGQRAIMARYLADPEGTCAAAQLDALAAGRRLIDTLKEARAALTAG
jgi:hypothetical protein